METPEEVVAVIRAFGGAGIIEITMQWTTPDDIEGLVILTTEEVLPRLDPQAPEGRWGGRAASG